MTLIISPTIGPVDLAESGDLVVSGPTTLLADGLQVDEFIIVWRKGPSGSYYPVTETLYLSAIPNMLVLDATGTYRFTKYLTDNEASLSFEGEAVYAGGTELTYLVDDAVDYITHNGLLVTT